MSIESAKAFVEKMASDDAFRAKLEQAASDEDRKQMVKDAGFEFTKDELKAVVAESGKGELSEKDLEAVAGGSSATWVAVAVAVVGAAAASA